MERARSEYRAILAGTHHMALLAARSPLAADRAALANLLLDAYRHTIDDEGESIDDAFDAIDAYLASIVHRHSVVLDGDSDSLAAMSFVVVVDGVHYIDPVAVRPTMKRGGLGRAMVATSLASLGADGVAEVGATITDGNLASERLFAGLGFERVGAWD